jgi:hypothetical protein
VVVIFASRGQGAINEEAGATDSSANIYYPLGNADLCVTARMAAVVRAAHSNFGAIPHDDDGHGDDIGGNNLSGGKGAEMTAMGKLVRWLMVTAPVAVILYLALTMPPQLWVWLEHALGWTLMIVAVDLVILVVMMVYLAAQGLRGN